MAKHANRRIPKLRFTKLRDIGWHVFYRDATSALYRAGAAEKLGGNTDGKCRRELNQPQSADPPAGPFRAACWRPAAASRSPSGFVSAAR